MPPPPPRRSLFARLESGSFDELTHEDELRGGLVAMVAASAQQTRVATARTHNEAEPEPSAAAASDETTTAAASMPAVAAPSGVDCSSPHLFSLLARYPSECNRISRYLQLDSSALWDAVKRQSRFALHSAEADRLDRDSILFERGDPEARVRLVLTELRQIARALRRLQRQKNSDSAPAANAASANLPTPQKSITLSRASSLTPMAQLPLPSTPPAAPPLCSPLLTHPLFATELSYILPVLFLRCRNESTHTSGLTDDEDEDDSTPDRGAQVNLTERLAQGASSPHHDDDHDDDEPMDSNAGVPVFPGRSLFIPLRDLVHVLLHQGPVHAPRFLTLLAFAHPHSLPPILDACFEWLRAQLACVRDKLHAASQHLPSLMRDPQLLSKGVMRVWRQSFLLMHSDPFPGLYASLLSLAALDVPHTALSIRLRAVQMMDLLNLAPPTLALPPPPPPAPAAVTSALGGAASVPAATAAASASATASVPAAASAPSGPLSTPVRLRAPPVPPPLNAQSSAARPVTPLFNAAASSNTLTGASPSPAPAPAAAAAAATPASASISFATPSLLAALLGQCWSPLSHFLPRLSLGVTLQLLRDPSSFLASIVARANAPSGTLKVSAAMPAADDSPETRSTSAHRMLEYLRDHRFSEEYSDLIGPAMQAAHQATLTAAANAAAQKEKSRLAAEAAAPPVKGKKKLLREAKQRAKAEAAAASLTGQQSTEQQPADSIPATPLSSRAGGPSTSPSLSAHKSSGAQSQLVPAITSNSPQRNGQLHAGFSSPTLHSVQFKEANGPHKPHTQQPRPTGANAAVEFIHPSERSSVEAALSLYASGSIDRLRVQLFARLQLLAEQHAQQFAQLRHHSSAAISGVCSELARMLQLYCHLILHCQFHLRTRELQVVQQLIPPVDQTEAALSVVSSAPALLVVVSRLHQLVLVVLCICPTATESSATCGWQVTLQTLLRLKRWMADMQGALVQTAAARPDADRSLGGVSNLLLQLGIAAQHSKHSPHSEINHLLRALLRLPASFKPTLLHPHSVSSHLRELQFGLVQAHVWPKFEVLPEVFSLEWIRPDGGGPQAALLRRDEHGMLHLRSASPALARALSTRIDHAYHLLRPTPTAVQSLVPRPYFEFGVGFWLSSLLRIDAAAGPDPAAPSLSMCLSHPLLCHASILPLLDSVAQFDLSAAILEQQQAQSHGQVRPAHQRRDQRAIKEEEMRDIIQMHLHSGGASPRALPCVPDLRNPIGLILCVYYLLSYNSLAFQLSWKCLPPAPQSDARSLLDGNDEHEDVEQVTAPDAPFTPALAQSISVASAVAPYPPHICDGLPLRGILEFIKRLRAHSNKQDQARTGATADADLSATAAAANVQSLYSSLYRLLLQLHPESLIGFDVACEANSADDVCALQSQDMRTEGAILALTTQDQTTSVMPAALEDERSNLLSPLEMSAVLSQYDSLQLPRALQELQHVISASSAPLSSYAESFLFQVLRPLCRTAASPLHSSVERVWLSFYSSGLSSSEFVTRSLHCLLVDAEEEAKSAIEEAQQWAQFEATSTALDPMQLLLLAPSRALCAPSLFRVFLICLYHRLVSSSSYFAVLGKSEYVSLQLLTQSLHHSTHAGWALASKLLAPTPNPHERKSCKEVEPMTLYIHAYIDKFLSGTQQGSNEPSKKPTAPPSLRRELTPTSAPILSPFPVATAAAVVVGDPVVPSDRPPLKRQRLQDPSSSSSPIAPDDERNTIKNEEAEATSEQQTHSGRQSTAKHDAMASGMEETSSAGPALPLPSSSTGPSGQCVPVLPSPSSSSSAPVPRPFSFLVSDRVLSPGEQLIFSADFALAMPHAEARTDEERGDDAGTLHGQRGQQEDQEDDSESDSAKRAQPHAERKRRQEQAESRQSQSPAQSPDPLTTPTLRVFAYLLTTRAAIAQRLLDHALSQLRSIPLPLPLPLPSEFAAGSSGVPLPAAPLPVLSCVRACVSLVYSFLGLLLRASSPPASQSPSSLLLLLHVQSYPCELLPLFCMHFEAQLQPLMQPGLLRDRIQAGVGERSAADRRARHKFISICTLLTQQQHKNKQQQQQNTPEKHTSAERDAREATAALQQMLSQQPRSTLLRDWLRSAVLFPQLAPLVTTVAQQMLSSDATLF